MLFRRDAALGVLAFAASAPQFVSALDPNICADFNTATGKKMTYNLQSNGYCHDHCNADGDWAFAITKSYDCWCSNYTPADSVQVNLSDCDFPCWGFPQEPCGGDNAFGYVKIGDNQPAGTRGPSSGSSSSSSSRPAPTQDAPEPSTEPPSSTSESSSESTTTRSSTTSESTTEQVSTAVRTVTADGTIKTVFVGPTSTPDDNNNNNNNSGTSGDSNRADGELMDSGGGGGGGVSKGALAGIIVGVALGVIAVVAAGLWWFFRRRKSQQQQEDYQEDPSIRGSSSGMMGGGQRQEMSMGGGSPGSPNTSSNRNSALMIDPRMDPFKQGLYVRSASHESINTLRDDHDYSRRIQQRTLRATNPDPE